LPAYSNLKSKPGGWHPVQVNALYGERPTVYVRIGHQSIELAADPSSQEITTINVFSDIGDTYKASFMFNVANLLKAVANLK